MGINLGDVFPDFTADSSHGKIKFHEWLGTSWGILFSHPADYTPVCTTELGLVAKMVPEFQKRNVKLIALSVDDSESHRGWIKDIQAYTGESGDFPFPILCDEKRELSIKLGMLDAKEKDSKGMPLNCRSVFIIGPDKKLRLSILYPATTGRNFNEILRVVDSLQLTETKQVATPANWCKGDRVMVVPSVKQEDTGKLYPQGVEVFPLPSKKPYLRFTPQP